MATATDDGILARALETNAIIVTLDADFHTMLAVSGATGPSVIRFRVQRLHAPEIVRLTQMVLVEFEAEVKGGCLLTIKPRKVTCHGLPIGRSD